MSEPLLEELSKLNDACTTIKRLNYGYLALLKSKWEEGDESLPTRYEAISKERELLRKEREAEFERLIDLCAFARSNDLIMQHIEKKQIHMQKHKKNVITKIMNNHERIKRKEKRREEKKRRREREEEKLEEVTNGREEEKLNKKKEEENKKQSEEHEQLKMNQEKPAEPVEIVGESETSDHIHHNMNKSGEKTNSVANNSSQIEAMVLPFFLRYSLLPNDLVSMAKELDSFITDSTKTTPEVYDKLKNESWELRGIINKTAFDQKQIKYLATQLMDRLESYNNEDVKIVMRNYIAKRLVAKGKESREPSVCMSFSFLMAELATRDSLFVNVAMAQLFLQCPLIRFEINPVDDLSDKQFEDMMIHHSMCFSFFAGLFVYNQQEFTVEFAWRWVSSFVQVASHYPFLEFAGTAKSFLEVCGFLLKRDYGQAFDDLMNNISRNVIPRIDNIPARSRGSLTRLQELIKSAFAVPDYCLLN